MTDVERSVHVLASIARLDVTARDQKAELAKIPALVNRVDRELADLAAREEKAVSEFKKLGATLVAICLVLSTLQYMADFQEVDLPQSI